MCWTHPSTVCGLVERDIMKSTERPFPVPDSLAKNKRSVLTQPMNDDNLIIEPAHIVEQGSQKM